MPPGYRAGTIGPQEDDMTAMKPLLRDQRGAAAMKLAITIAAVAILAQPQRTLSMLDHAKSHWEGVWSVISV